MHMRPNPHRNLWNLHQNAKIQNALLDPTAVCRLDSTPEIRSITIRSHKQTTKETIKQSI
jgi:hypothetical protein